VVAETFHADHIYAEFDADTWNQIVKDWDTIKPQLDSGNLPKGFTYHWETIDRTLEVADALGMDVRTENVLTDASRTPSAILDGNYSPAELEHIYEFMVKVPVIHYHGQISDWLVVSETTGRLSSGRGPEKSWGFPYLQLGGVDIVEKAYRWAREADPDATLIYTDDHFLLKKMVSDYGPTQPHWNQVFLNTISELKRRDAPVDTIDIENNFWIYNPPDPEFMRQQLIQIQELGYSLYAPEVTVVTSDAFPVSSIQSKKLAGVENPLAVQALIYQQTLQAYLDLGVPYFGLGGLTDRYSFWLYSGYPETHAMIFDYNQQPKVAYYALVGAFYNHLNQK
jgi:endo-1,4-beta-xylanase